MSFLKKLLGDSNERETKRLMKTVQQIEALEPAMQALSDSELKAKTAELKKGMPAASLWMNCCRKPLLL